MLEAKPFCEYQHFGEAYCVLTPSDLHQELLQQSLCHNHQDQPQVFAERELVSIEIITNMDT